MKRVYVNEKYIPKGLTREDFTARVVTQKGDTLELELKDCDGRVLAEGYTVHPEDEIVALKEQTEALKAQIEALKSQAVVKDKDKP